MWSSGLTQNLANDHAHFSISVFVAVLCLCIVIGQLLEQNRWINESITAILMGCITGTIILLWSKGTNSHIVRFEEELFFIYLLSPIIFNAGFQVKKKQFFRNFLTIMLFGVVGVFISSAIISAGSWWLFPKIGFSGLLAKEYLAIGTIFSSTDTVCTLQVLNQDETPLLYSLVFGEGVVNDATSVVLFNAVQKLVVSRLDGWAAVHVFGDFLYLFFNKHCSWSCCIQLIVKFSLMVLIAYLSYMLAELLHLSGILTVFFCGIVMSHYAGHNLTENSRITTRHTFATMSFIAETFIFLYVGMDALDIEKWKMSKTSFKTSMGLCCSIILLILLGRAAFILIWWAGLMRGAVSIALAFNQFTFSGITWNPVHVTMVNSTVIVVLFTTLVFSFFTKPLIDVLLPHHARDNHHNQVPNSAMEELELPLLNFEESATENILRAKSSISMLIERPVYTIHSYWRKFGGAYMRPVFGGPR